jgi:hypothetical protein
MDPNALLQMIRTLSARRIQNEGKGTPTSPAWKQADSLALAEACLNFDEWLTSGGTLPKAWNAAMRW